MSMPLFSSFFRMMLLLIVVVVGGGSGCRLVCIRSLLARAIFTM